MKLRLPSIALLAALVISPLYASAAEPAVCHKPGETEKIIYSWRLTGGLSWIVGLAFPTSGTAELVTIERQSSATIDTELLITGGESEDYYRYESEIEEEGLRTVMSLHGYSWGKKYKEERARLDYDSATATTVKKSYKHDKDRIEKEAIPDGKLRDILTAIYYLRVHASSISRPIATSVYSDGKLYRVLYKPLGKRIRSISAKEIETVGFEISARPGDENKWPGGVEVWFTNDDRGIPVRISIRQRFATMQLELASAACGQKRILASVLR